MKIAIVTKYEGMNIHFNTWANEENRINWRKDFFRATRCTVAYAATELKAFLEQIVKNSEIYFSYKADGDFNIEIITENEQGKECDYSLEPTKTGVKIIGKTRVGALYGAYELLKIQGFRWFTQGEAGTYTPEKTDRITVPKKREDFSPAMDIMRGFDFEGNLPGEAIWVWMARNRLNGVRPQAGLVPLQNKLGMIFKEGGHFFQSFLSPNSILPDGTSVFETHPEWFGVRADGKEVTPENAMRTQFCVSNDAVCKYFSDEVVRRLNDEWYDADRLDIWGFDTWGGTCSCEKCLELGNSSDQTLHMLSKLREAIDNADLDRKVELVLCAYGGTSTLEAPINAIPQNLIDAGDIITYYPITRCYKHHFDEGPCKENEYLFKCLNDWLNKKPAMPIIMGEYYNLSKWEELPVVITDAICYDMPMYVKMGIKGITYMHLPLGNWGVKAITQYIYSNLSWDPTLDKETLLNDYFEKRYGRNAEAMKGVYAKLEEAFCDVQIWRSWAPDSILSQFLIWNGNIPTKPLDASNHYKDHKDIILNGRKHLALLKEAYKEVYDLKKYYLTSLEETNEIRIAMNPAELCGLRANDPDEYKLGEVLRSIKYAIDVMTLMVATVEYYDALYNGKESADIFAQMEKTYDILDSYLTCADRSTFWFGGESPSALQRSQMGRMVRRCASFRKNHPEIK